jgi:sensor c-di-GMP phosphodiesterase-like protein
MGMECRAAYRITTPRCLQSSGHVARLEVASNIVLGNAEAAATHACANDNAHVFYAENLTARVAERLALENQLRYALKRDEFIAHYQPKISLRDGASKR